MENRPGEDPAFRTPENNEALEPVLIEQLSAYLGFEESENLLALKAQAPEVVASGNEEAIKQLFAEYCAEGEGIVDQTTGEVFQAAIIGLNVAKALIWKDVINDYYWEDLADAVEQVKDRQQYHALAGSRAEKAMDNAEAKSQAQQLEYWRGVEKIIRNAMAAIPEE